MIEAREHHRRGVQTSPAQGQNRRDPRKHLFKAEHRKRIAAKAADALAISVASILASPEEGRAEALAQTFLEAEQYLAENLPSKKTKSFADDEDRARGGGDKGADHHASKRTSKSATETKEKSMTRQDAPDYIAKDFGVVRFSKIVVRDNDACNVGEAEFTKAVNVEASRRWPDMRPDAAFAKLISGESEDAVTLRRALQVIKVNQFAGAGYPYPA